VKNYTPPVLARSHRSIYPSCRHQLMCSEPDVWILANSSRLLRQKTSYGVAARERARSEISSLLAVDGPGLPAHSPCDLAHDQLSCCHYQSRHENHCDDLVPGSHGSVSPPFFCDLSTPYLCVSRQSGRVSRPDVNYSVWIRKAGSHRKSWSRSRKRTAVLSHLASWNGGIKLISCHGHAVPR
jgi:hypothetical protein